MLVSACYFLGGPPREIQGGICSVSHQPNTLRSHQESSQGDAWRTFRRFCVARSYSGGYTLMPSPLRFAEIRRQLEEAGYQLVRINGSHHIFDRPGGPLVSIPVHNGKVKFGYGRRIQKIVKGDEETSEREHEEEPPGEGEQS